MTLRTRRIIYSFFIFLFLVAAPVILIYASGYRFHFKKNRFEKTGVFFIESDPKNADIYVNGEIASDKTPGHVTKLLPNLYDIEVVKKGYQPWRNQLEIRPNLTTFVQSIQLFLQDITPQIVSEIPINSSVSQSPKRRYIAWTNGKLLSAYDTKSNKLKEVSLNKPINADIGKRQKIKWSQNDVYAAIPNKSFITVVYVADERSVSVDFPSLKTPSDTSIRFDGTQDELFYIHTSNDIYRYNILTKTQTRLLSSEDSIIDFFPSQEGLYYLTLSNEQILMNFLPSGADDVDAEVLSTLPLSNVYFISASTHLIVLLDRAASQLYLIRPNAKQESMKTIIIYRVKSAKWSPDKEKILLLNKFEIRYLHFPNGNTDKNGTIEILARLSHPITAAAWYNDSAHALFGHDGSIDAYELFKAGRRNNWTLARFSEVLDIFPSINKKELFARARVVEKTQLYRLDVQ